MNTKFMQMAIGLARQKMEEGEGGPFGAVIVKNGRVIAEGWNRVTSTGDPTAHAEIDAIRKACAVLNDYQLKDCEIYMSCEPCPMCLGAIYWARPNKVYFAATKDDAAKIGFDDRFIYEEIDRDFGTRSIPFSQLMQNEAREVFREWEKKGNKRMY